MNRLIITVTGFTYMVSLSIPSKHMDTNCESMNRHSACEDTFPFLVV